MVTKHKNDKIAEKKNLRKNLKPKTDKKLKNKKSSNFSLLDGKNLDYRF